MTLTHYTGLSDHRSRAVSPINRSRCGTAFEPQTADNEVKAASLVYLYDERGLALVSRPLWLVGLHIAATIRLARDLRYRLR